jgi:hypothetical protein
MQRRHFVKALVAAPAAPALLAQQPARQTAPQPAQETPKLEITMPDETADPVPRFFTEQQLAALRRLCDLLMPATGAAPGALKIGVPEFLDFLVGQSPAEKQQIYRAGLDALNAAAKKSYSQPFAGVDASQADHLLAPLRAPWTYAEPSDPLARFLRLAKAEVRTAAANSREYIAASSAGGRRGGGSGLYWYPLE